MPGAGVSCAAGSREGPGAAGPWVNSGGSGEVLRRDEYLKIHSRWRSPEPVLGAEDSFTGKMGGQAFVTLLAGPAALVFGREYAGDIPGHCDLVRQPSYHHSRANMPWRRKK